MKRLWLTLFEEYFVHENNRAYPCWIGIRYRFRGGLKREALQSALEQTVRRHPLLSSVVRREENGRLYWEQVPGWKPVLDWREDAHGTEGMEWNFTDLFREPGFRLVVAPVSGGTEVLLQSHHALLDGAGVFAVFHEVLLNYARGQGQTVELPELKPELFPDRNRFGLTLAEKIKMIPSQLVGLLVCAQLQSRKAASLVPHRVRPDNAPAPAGWPAVASRSFSADDYNAIREAAKKRGVGTNDFFIRDFFAAIGVWRTAQGVGQSSDWIRMGVPMSLRRPADRCLSAANVISVVTIDRPATSLGNRARLLRRACEDMEWIKTKKLSHTFLVMLGIYRALPGGIRRFTAREDCQSTVMLTNLSQLFSRSPLQNAQRQIEVPGAVLEDITVIAPYRPGTCASLSVSIYAGRLLADLHYDPRFLTRTQADGLLEAFRAQLKLSVESEG